MMCRGIEVLPIDLRKSHSRKFLVENGAMRLPIGILPGVGEKAAADIPDVVGSMLDGAFYALAALGGIGVGVGATILAQKVKKKKETTVAL